MTDQMIPEIDFLQVADENKCPNAVETGMTEFKRKELNGELVPEPLLMEDKTRFVLFPIKHTDVRILLFTNCVPMLIL